MSVLTHEVAKALRDRVNANDPLELIRDTEQAVLERLAAGVSVEPVAWIKREDGMNHMTSSFQVAQTDDAYQELATVDSCADAIAAARLQGEQDAIKRLSEGVSVEPAYIQDACQLDRAKGCCRALHCTRKIGVYTLDQLTAAIAAARVAALEEAAKVCEAHTGRDVSPAWNTSAMHCAGAIRELIGVSKC